MHNVKSYSVSLVSITSESIVSLSPIFSYIQASPFSSIPSKLLIVIIIIVIRTCASVFWVEENRIYYE